MKKPYHDSCGPRERGQREQFCEANGQILFPILSLIDNASQVVVGLVPFVTTLPASAKAGDRVNILGIHLAGSTAVTFDNISAGFTIISDTLVSAIVPLGATSGRVRVTTPTDILVSNVPFRVTK